MLYLTSLILFITFLLFLGCGIKGIIDNSIIIQIIVGLIGVTSLIFLIVAISVQVSRC